MTLNEVTLVNVFSILQRKDKMIPNLRHFLSQVTIKQTFISDCFHIKNTKQGRDMVTFEANEKIKKSDMKMEVKWSVSFLLFASG